MPNLLLFAPCEKVLVDQQTNTVSLIGILQELHFKWPPGTPIQANALLPLTWSIITLWQEEEQADAAVEFEQRLMLENAAGTSLFSNDVRWTFTRPSHRIVATIPGMPISWRRLTLKLSYHVAGTRDWHEAAAFPMEIVQELL
jgi:hypothetical protein